MARGKSLLKLLDDVRSEAKLSLNAAHNKQARDVQVMHIQRVQEWLWDDFAWPHLRVERLMPAVVGQRYYSPPDDIPLERLECVEVFRDGCWAPLHPAITGRDYAVWNSDLGQRSWPPRAWRLHEDQDVEIWPVPDQAVDLVTNEGMLRFIGIRRLNRLVDDADRADLDDRLIVLQTAGEILSGAGDKSGAIKIAQASQLYVRLKSQLTKSACFQMFGVGHERRGRRHDFIASYKPPVIY